MNQFVSDVRMTFSLSEYPKGRTIFGFNFSPDLSDGCGTDSHISLTNKGLMRTEVHLKKPLPETINVLIRDEYDILIMIPEDRKTILDYHWIDPTTIDKQHSNEKYYFGTVARDRIPEAKLKSHGALIVNTEASSKEGNIG